MKNTPTIPFRQVINSMQVEDKKNLQRIPPEAARSKSRLQSVITQKQMCTENRTLPEKQVIPSHGNTRLGIDGLFAEPSFFMPGNPSRPHSPGQVPSSEFAGEVRRILLVPDQDDAGLKSCNPAFLRYIIFTGGNNDDCFAHKRGEL